MLYNVSLSKKDPYIDGQWNDYNVFAVAETCAEAVAKAKRKLRSSDKDYRWANATVVDTYSNRGPYKLYRVRYSNWSMDFSRTTGEEVLVIGRCEEEAICYAKAYAPLDALNFNALEVPTVCGHNIIVD